MIIVLEVEESELTESYNARILNSKVLLIFVVALLTSCAKGDVIYIDDDEEWLTDQRPLVFFLYAEEDLGDLGYADNVYRGVVRASDSNNLLLSCVETSSEVFEKTFDSFLSVLSNLEEDRRILVVVFNKGYEEIYHSYEDSIKQIDDVDILFVESSDSTLSSYTLNCEDYGVYYLAGCVVGSGLSDVSRILLVSANGTNMILEGMRRGFCDGITASNSEIEVSNYYISDSSNYGYDAEDILYEYSDEINKKYQLVLPLCGGSIQGLLRYNREHSESFYTIGVDVDMQAYSSKVPFSVVQRLDGAVEKWINRWAKGESQERHQSYGLADSYTGIVVSEGYRNQLDEVVSQYLQTAIGKEKEYQNE